MTLLEQEQMQTMLTTLPRTATMAGGSIANTLVALAEDGLNTAFIGKVGDDKLGKVFCEDLSRLTIDFTTAPLQGGRSGCCLVLITPDGERTMHTYLGASRHLAVSDINDNTLKNASYFLAEGYLFDSPTARESFYHACDIVRSGGGAVVFSLSDPLCVARHREDFQQVAQTATWLFGNEAEAHTLYGTKTLPALLDCLHSHPPSAVITRGEAGAVIIHEGETITITAHPVSKVVDLTGAGDHFMAGFFSALIAGKSIAESGQAGAEAGAKIIGQIGSRTTPLNLA